MSVPIEPLAKPRPEPCALCRGLGALRASTYELYRWDEEMQSHHYAFCCAAHLPQCVREYPDARVTRIAE